MKTYERNDFKLSFFKEDTEFYVNEKKKTVACTIVGRLNTPCEFSFHNKVPFVVPSEMFATTGIAKCSNGDVFDIERGKRIALAKAENKAYRKASRHLFELQKHLSFLSSCIDKFLSKSFHQCSHNDDFIQTISDTNHPEYKEKISSMKSNNVHEI